MSSVYEAKEEMHQIEAQLYPNHLQGGEGTYFAKNTKEKTINVDAVCAAMCNRGGYDASHEEAVKTVNHFFKEVMYQLCDGFSVNTGWFTINVSFSGLFHSPKEPFTPPKHKVSFSFHMLKAMRNLTNLIEVIVNDHIEDPAYISEFRDMEKTCPATFTIWATCASLRATGLRSKAPPPRPASGWFPSWTPPKP